MDGAVREWPLRFVSAGLAWARRRTFRSRGIALGVLVGLAILAGLHAYHYYPFFADDSFISLRYSERLLEGKGLTWTDGERVEGYSNLLWVLGCAFIGAFGVELVAAARLLGALCTVATLGAFVYRYHARNPDGWPLPALFGAFFLAASGTIAIWTIGGLETVMVGALLAWAYVLLQPLLEPQCERPLRTAAVVGVVLGLLCWTRPDGPLFVVVFAAALVVGQVFRPRAFLIAFVLCAVPLAFYAAQLGFRLSYYGEWVPNTALAKVAFNEHRWQQGYKYVKGALQYTWPLVAGAASAIVPLLLRAPGRRRVLALLLPVAAWLAYVCAIGGDIFPARRHLIPAVVLLTLVLIEGLDALECAAQQMPPRRGTTPHGFTMAPLFPRLGYTIALLLLAAFLPAQLADPQNRRGIEERWEWDAPPIGALLNRHFAHADPLLATDPAGCMPFYSKFDSVDMLGLNDSYLAHHPPPDFGRGPLAHDLGDGKYVLSREPTLVVLSLPAGQRRGRTRSAREMQAQPQFRQLYTPVTFEATESDVPYAQPVRSVVWVRRESSIGVQRTEREVFVPGYLLATSDQTRANEHAGGRLGTVFSKAHPATLPDLELPAGHWELLPDFIGVDVYASLLERNRVVVDRRLMGHGGRLRFETHGGAITLRLASATNGLTQVFDVRFVRVNP